MDDPVVESSFRLRRRLVSKIRMAAITQTTNNNPAMAMPMAKSL